MAGISSRTRTSGSGSANRWRRRSDDWPLSSRKWRNSSRRRPAFPWAWRSSSDRWPWARDARAARIGVPAFEPRGGSMQLTQRHQEYWRRNLRITGILLAIWFFVTYVIGFFARELTFKFFGWPFSFYMAAQ